MSYKLLVMSCAAKRRNGQLLLELLIAVGVSVVIAAAVAQIVSVSLRSNQSAGEQNVALGLAETTFEAVKSAATENWLNLYNLTHSTGTTAYYPAQSSTRWIVNTTGTEIVNINNAAYSRSFYVQHVCRDTSTRSITGITDSSGVSTSSCATSGGSADPSTQKITATVSWSTGNPVSYTDYATRWRNVVCSQTSWTSASSGPATCPATYYGSATNVTVGATLQLCSGGC